MMTRTNVSSLFCAALLLVSADAFCPNAMPSRSIVRAASPDSNTPPDAASQATTVSNGFARFFAFSAAASIFAFQPMATLAAPMDVGTVSPFVSSSVQIAEVTRTLDMSMPSYGEIIDPHASTDNVASLTIAPAPRAVYERQVKEVKEVKAADSDSESMFGGLLPSMNKKGPATTAAADAPVVKAKPAAKSSSSVSYDF